MVGSLRSRRLTSYSLSPPFSLIVSSHLRTSFVSAASPSVFHTAFCPRVSPLNSGSVASSPWPSNGATKDFARGYWWYARETSGPSLPLIRSPLLPPPPPSFLLNLSFVGSNITKVSRDVTTRVRSIREPRL